MPSREKPSRKPNQEGNACSSMALSTITFNGQGAASSSKIMSTVSAMAAVSGLRYGRMIDRGAGARRLRRSTPLSAVAPFGAMPSPENRRKRAGQ